MNFRALEKSESLKSPGNLILKKGTNPVHYNGVRYSGVPQYFVHTSQGIKTLLVVSAGYTGAGRVLQAKIYWPECSPQIALYSEKSHCTFTSQYLASQQLYWFELTDMWVALLRHIVRDL